MKEQRKERRKEKGVEKKKCVGKGYHFVKEEKTTTIPNKF